jgi:hypothetical protein
MDASLKADPEIPLDPPISFDLFYSMCPRFSIPAVSGNLILAGYRFRQIMDYTIVG